MTRIAPPEVKLRACDAQPEDVSSRLKVNLTELQGYFGGGPGNHLSGSLQQTIASRSLEVSSVEWLSGRETAAAPPCVYASVTVASWRGGASFLYVHSKLFE